MKKRPRKVRAQRRGWPALALLVAPLLILVAYRGVSGFELVGDARFLILENRFGHSLDQLVPALTHDYFWSSSGNTIQYWRPWTKLSWLIEWQVFHDFGGGYVWVNVVWHALGSLAVFALGRDLGLSRWVAVACAVLFGLHPVTIEAVSLVMARSDVVAASATVGAVLFWRRFRASTGWRRRGFLLLHLVAALLALGSKESALMLPLVLVVMAALDGDFSRERRRHLVGLLPTIAIAVGYFALRRHFLERQAVGLSATTLGFDPVRIFSCIGFYLRETFPLSLASGLRDLPFSEARSTPFVLKTLATLSVFGGLVAVAARRRDRQLLGSFAWTVLALLPVLLPRDIAVVSGGDRYPLADRWLHHAMAPALLAWVLLAKHASAALSERFQVPHTRLAWVGGLAMAAWACVLLARASSDRAELGSDLGMLENEDRLFYRAIPPEHRSAWDECRHDERMLAKASLERRPSRILELAPAAVARCGTPEIDAYYLEALYQTRRFDLAEPVARRLAARAPRDVRGHGRIAAVAGLTLLERGHTLEAKPLLEAGVRAGALGCASFVALAEAARRHGRPIEAATHAETAYACGAGRDPSLLVAAATWLAENGERERARAVLARLRGRDLSADQAAQVEAVERELANPVTPR